MSKRARSTKKGSRKKAVTDIETKALGASATRSVPRKRVKRLTRRLAAAARTEARRLRKFETARQRRIRLEAALAAVGLTAKAHEGAETGAPAETAAPDDQPTAASVPSTGRPKVATSRKRLPRTAPRTPVMANTVVAVPVSVGSKTNGASPD